MDNLQDNSLLASYDSDSLLHIFSRLPLSDAFHLGLTCRRLYDHFETSRRSTKALVMTGYHHYNDSHKWMILGRQQDFFLSSNIDSRKSAPEYGFSADQVQFDEQQLNSSLPLYISPKCLSLFGPNLHYLEVSTFLHSRNLAPLLTQLEAFSRLTTLKLYLDIINNYEHKSPDYLWRPLGELQVPSLRHLTVNMLNTLTRDKNAHEFDLPPLPVLEQLTTFTYFEDLPLNRLCELIKKITTQPYGGHLKPGIGFRFGLALYKEINLLQAESIEPTFLPYFTYLDVNIGQNIYNIREHNIGICRAALSSLYASLPLMCHLQKVELKMKAGAEKTSDYPATLAALSSLAHLRELSIDWFNNKKFVDGIRCWPQSDLPVLPTVHVLSLVYRTSVHTDFVEHLHLVHCFPALRKLQCHLLQGLCNHFNFDLSGEPDDAQFEQYQACGLQLTRGIWKLPKTVQQQMEVDFSFSEYQFRSLADLKAGKWSCGPHMW